MKIDFLQNTPKTLLATEQTGSSSNASNLFVFERLLVRISIGTPIILRYFTVSFNTPSKSPELGCDRFLHIITIQSLNVGFVVHKVSLVQCFSGYFSSPTNSHSTKCSILIYHGGLLQLADIPSEFGLTTPKT
jgi:hypothetical protein